MTSISYDPAKRAATLLERGLDFADAGMLFHERHFTRRDDRFDYGEERFISIGRLADDIVVVVWTWRGKARHIISMRKPHAREQKRYIEHL
jgi:uncharacterized DUF497 family protein